MGMSFSNLNPSQKTNIPENHKNRTGYPSRNGYNEMRQEARRNPEKRLEYLT